MNSSVPIANIVAVEDDPTTTTTPTTPNTRIQKRRKAALKLLKQLKANTGIDNDNESNQSTNRIGKLEFSVSVERWRLHAYSFFWFMCICAIAFTRTLVRPSLLAGPENEELAFCPPFDRVSDESLNCKF